MNWMKNECRRMKAESLESQLNLLSMTNKMLKQRIARMETISGAIKDGIGQIQTNNCNCLQTVATVQQVNRDFKDPADLSNSALLKTSKSYRDQNPELLLPPSSSDDDFSADLSSTNSPVPPVCGTAAAHQQTSFSGFLVKMNSAPMLTKIPASVSVPGTPVTPSTPVPVYPRAKTALDIINDTIIKSLGSSPSTSSSYPSSPSPVPLNLVKILPSQPVSQSTHLLSRQMSHGPMGGNSQMIVVAPTPTTTMLNVDIVKKEPESTTTTFTNGVDPVESCVAAAAADGHCRGPLHNLNKLTSYLNAVTGFPVSTDDGSSAMERAIIKSRLRIPFWKADEVSQP